MANIKPSKEVVVLEVEEEHQTASGLWTPNGDEKFRPEIGIVTAIGEGETPIKIKIGDRIIFRRYTENYIPVYGHKYNLINFKDILGVIEE